MIDLYDLPTSSLLPENEVAEVFGKVARVELPEPGISGVTQPRIPLCFMRATCCSMAISPPTMPS